MNEEEEKKLRREVGLLRIKCRRLDERLGELGKEFEKFKKDTELAVKLLNDEVRSW